MNAVTKSEGPREIAVLRDQFDKMGDQFHAALPAHIPVERFMRVVMTAIQNNPDLLKASRKSLFNAAMKAAQDGLLPDGREGAMVPFGGEITWMPMIGGIRKKVRNSGEIATWDVHAVYEKDAFEFELGDDPFIRHRPHLGDDRGDLIAVYSIATLKSGEKSRDVMSVSEIEKIRALSKGKNTPWNNLTFYPEMAKKTVARRHSKVLPMSSDLDDLIRRDDELYDLKGAKEEAQERRPRSLADRLDQIADGDPIDADPDTGEIIDHEQNLEPNSPSGSEGGKASPQGKAASKPSSDPAPRSDDGDPIAEARRRGADARDKGMSRKAVPAEFRKDERLMAAFLDGLDTGVAEDREPGADEEE